MPPTNQPDLTTRAIVPVLSLGLTTLLCCAETTIVSPTPARASRESPTPDPVATMGAIPPAVDVAPSDGSATRSPLTPAAIDLGPPAIRVRLERVRHPARLGFGIEGAWRLFDVELDDVDPGRDASPFATGSDLRDATAYAAAGSIRINGRDLKCAGVTIVADKESVRVGKRRYPGALILRAIGDEIVAINLVSLEEYVQGVLYAEMPERFANEALRAQAVVSRSYALYHAQRGHELRDDQGSQMYVGLEQTDDLARRIVDSTLGEVVTFDGVPIETYFHSTCGGNTASAAAVFGIAAPAPLCASVECPGCKSSPHYSWSRRVQRKDLDRLYKNALGVNLRIAPGDCDAAGRALRVDVIDGEGRTVDRPVADRLRNDFNIGRTLSKQLLSTWFTDVRVDKTQLVISGRGFGHGVGLCQYGAGGLASRGKSYRDILALYFPGAELKRLYE